MSTVANLAVQIDANCKGFLAGMQASTLAGSNFDAMMTVIASNTQRMADGFDKIGSTAAKAGQATRRERKSMLVVTPAT